MTKSILSDSYLDQVSKYISYDIRNKVYYCVRDLSDFKSIEKGSLVVYSDIYELSVDSIQFEIVMLFDGYFTDKVILKSRTEKYASKFTVTQKIIDDLLSAKEIGFFISPDSPSVRFLKD